MTLLAIIRHGETDWNVMRRMQGHRDIPLNERGRQQAARVAERLAPETWDVLMSSDLSRAAETADIIAGRIGAVERVFDPRLRERGLGRLEGSTPEERVQRWGENWHELDHGAESDEALFARAAGFLDETAARYQGKRLVVVTHGGWIKTLFAGLFPDLAQGHPANTSLSMIRRGDGGWHCLMYNAADHLEG